MKNNYPPPMNNPVAMMATAMRQGKNPMNVLQTLATRDPQAAQMMQLVRGKGTEQLRQMASNVAENYGMTLSQAEQEVAKRLGLM